MSPVNVPKIHNTSYPMLSPSPTRVGTYWPLRLIPNVKLKVRLMLSLCFS